MHAELPADEVHGVSGGEGEEESGDVQNDVAEKVGGMFRGWGVEEDIEVACLVVVAGREDAGFHGGWGDFVYGVGDEG